MEIQYGNLEGNREGRGQTRTALMNFLKSLAGSKLFYTGTFLPNIFNESLNSANCKYIILFSFTSC